MNRSLAHHLRRTRGWHLAAALVVALVACGAPAPGSLPMDWQPVAELNADLPDGVRVFAGRNRSLPLRAWYVRVREPDPRIVTRVALSPDDDRRETASGFAQRLGACVVVNGGYFRMDLNPARHVGLLLVDSVMSAPPTPSVLRGERRYPIARAALGFSGAGGIDVAWPILSDGRLLEISSPPAHRPGRPDSLFNPSTARPWPVREALAAGPALISAGAIAITADEEVFFGSSIPEVHPRTAAGYTVEGDLILLVVDGRQEASRGVDLPQLARLLLDLGCVEGLNLDGGGSSTLVVNGQLVNRPAGGSTEREVMSALAVFCEP